ncbi:uncharacterized protein LOC125489477 [Plutella xylostella]|uniref:uncharacterized protein LOC125489477 n=1 Tax=Plutella xylostella TaxID=51655 RepID=UPI0020331A43|nr:uncharacterized protein LOC125489477 [Plutella xylostella]
MNNAESHGNKPISCTFGGFTIDQKRWRQDEKTGPLKIYGMQQIQLKMDKDEAAVRLCLGCGWGCACGCGGAAGVASVYISRCRPGVGAVVTAVVRAVNININRTKAGGTVEEMAISGVSTQTEDTRPYHTRLRRESELRFACSMADGRQWRRCHQQDWSYIYSCMITMIIIRSTELGVIYILFS